MRRRTLYITPPRFIRAAFPNPSSMQTLYDSDSLYSGYFDSYAASINPSNAIQSFSTGSSSHYPDQSRHDRGGPSTSFSSTVYPEPPLIHATGLAISENLTSSPNEYYPEDIWGSSLVQGHPQSIALLPPDIIFPAKSYTEPISVEPASSSLPTLADMAIIYSSVGPPSGRQPQSGEEPQVPSSTQDEEVRSERRHPCPMCHKRFDRPSTLKKHMLVHTGEKAFQCETCGRRFGVHSNLNRHRARCILKPVHAAALRGSSQEAQDSTVDVRGRAPAKPKPAAQKRRRRAPSPTVWIPESLKSFNLVSEDLQKVTPVPLPPITPSQYDERDSWDENVGVTPYHPNDWEYRPRLPGPARQLQGLGEKNMRNFDFAGQGGFMIAAY